MMLKMFVVLSTNLDKSRKYLYNSTMIKNMLSDFPKNRKDFKYAFFPSRR